MQPLADSFILDGPFIEALTGYNIPSKQADCLRRHNIFYIEGKGGTIRTTLAWVKQAGIPVNQTHDEFNLSALD